MCWFSGMLQPSATHPNFGTNLLRTWTMLSSFDEISLLFETTRRYFRPRYVVLAIAELSRAITIFHQMMITLSMPCGHFRQFVKTVNHEFSWNFGVNIWNVRMAWTMLSSFDEISLFFETTQQSLGPRNSETLASFLNNSELHPNDDNVAQARGRFVQK